MAEKVKSKAGRHSALLVLTALIWGIAFVAQSEGGEATGPYTFCFLRYLIGGAVLLPVIKIFNKKGLAVKPTERADKKQLAAGGLCCGLCLSVATIFQQLGIYLGVSAGKAGFLTACYIILVPIFGLLLKRKCGVNVWIAVAVTVAGLYLLCMNGSLSIEKCDAFVLLCSVIYSLHILVVDHFTSKNVDGVRMSCIQFFVAAAVSMVPMFFVELHHSFSEVPQAMAVAFGREARIPLLYTAVMSTGVAYTLQIIGQKGVNPTVASLLMSLESVFSVLADWIILGRSLSLREIFGCIMIFIAIVLAQLPMKIKKNAVSSSRYGKRLSKKRIYAPKQQND